MNIYTTVIDVHQSVSKTREVTDGQNLTVSSAHPFCIVEQTLITA